MWFPKDLSTLYSIQEVGELLPQNSKRSVYCTLNTGYGHHHGSIAPSFSLISLVGLLLPLPLLLLLLLFCARQHLEQREDGREDRHPSEETHGAADPDQAVDRAHQPGCGIRRASKNGF